MSQLKDPRGTIIVKLPSFPEDEVILYKGLTKRQFSEFSKKEKLENWHMFDSVYQRDLVKFNFTITKTMIKSWTFTDENDKLLEISTETLNLLPDKDFEILSDSAMKMIDIKI